MSRVVVLAAIPRDASPDGVGVWQKTKKTWIKTESGGHVKAEGWFTRRADIEGEVADDQLADMAELTAKRKRLAGLPAEFRAGG